MSGSCSNPLWSFSLPWILHYSLFIFTKIIVYYHHLWFVMVHTRFHHLKLNHRTKREQAALRPPQVWSLQCRFYYQLSVSISKHEMKVNFRSKLGIVYIEEQFFFKLICFQPWLICFDLNTIDIKENNSSSTVRIFDLKKKMKK